MERAIYYADARKLNDAGECRPDDLDGEAETIDAEKRCERLKGAPAFKFRGVTHGDIVAVLSKVLTTAKIARAEALDLLERVNAGTGDLEGSERLGIVEVLNGTLADYNQNIKRLSRRRHIRDEAAACLNAYAGPNWR